MPLPNEHSARLRSPGDFAKEAKWRSGSPGQFRRTTSTTIFGRIKIPAGVSVIWGKLKDKAGANDPPVPQALRFKKGTWTEKAAKDWLKENKLDERIKQFEPAADENAETELDTFDHDDIEMPSTRLTMKDIEGMSDTELGAMMRKTLNEQMERKRIVISAYEDDEVPEVIEEADLSLEFEELDEETVESDLPTDTISLTDELTPDDYALKETSKWIPIFKVGKWKGTSFSLNDLKHIATNFFKFKNKVTPALKLGHGGESGQPAAGWVTSLKVVGDLLMAKFGQVPSKINKLVRDGEYKRISAEVYKDLEIDGKKYGLALAGVALLGADPPAVKDLPPLESLYNNNTALYLLTYDESGEIAKITEYDKEAIDMPETRTDTEEEVVEETSDEETPAEKTTEETPAEEKTPAEETTAEPVIDEATAARIARLEKLVETSTATIAKQQADMDTQKNEARHEREVAFMEGLKREGKLTPAQDEPVKHLFDTLAGDPTVIKLSETDADGAVTERDESIYTIFESFLKGLPVAIDFSERALDTNEQPSVMKADEAKYGLGEFKNNRGKYDITGLEVDKLVEKYMADNPTVDMEEALIEVVLSHPELAEV
jgi:hypothetical protein